MYDELVYLLDLCILSYHLHSQTLIWPMDPYYEQMGEPLLPKAKRTRRKKFMTEVHAYFTGNSRFHGPGSCQAASADWATNPLLDPIISMYYRIYPWRPSFTRPNRENEPWIVYNPPQVITDRINVVKMVRYSSNAGPYHGRPQVQVDDIHLQRPALAGPARPAATDLLYCFEGGTGAIEESGKTASWGLMGFVLARTVSRAELKITNPGIPEPYDVYIVFRGSRSGKLRKKESLWSEVGNPDWVTDLDFFRLVEDKVISDSGSCCRGFRTSIKSMLPTVIKCLQEIHATKNGPPRTIYVTGHSLGGALAAHFTSAIVRGTTYGLYGVGPKMPDELKVWPWRLMQLVTFSAPVVGGNTFHQSFDMALTSRRIWLDGDPITQERWHYPIGQPYRIPKKEGSPILSTASHEPYLLRRNLIRDRRKAGFSIDDIPANIEDDPAEPWKLFDTCQAVLGHLQKCGASLSECLSDFDVEFKRYLSILILLEQKLDPLNVGPPQSLALLLNGIDALPSPLALANVISLQQSWKDAAPAYQGLEDSALYNFLGLCLVLCALSKDQQVFTQVTTCSALSDFKKILESKM